MFAWFEMVPDTVPSTVTLNLMTLVAFTAKFPPVVALAPVPRRTVSVLVAAVKLFENAT